MIQSVSTIDVPEEALEKLAASMAPDVVLTVKDRAVLKSAEPPSWVLLLADAPFWAKMLGAGAALYVAEIIKEAGKESWRNRGNAIDAIAGATNSIRSLATKLSVFRQRLEDRTTLEIGVPFPDDYFATRLQLSGSDPGDLALQIALFLHYLPFVVRVIEDEQLSPKEIATGIYLELRDDGSLGMSWVEFDAHKAQRRSIEMSGTVTRIEQGSNSS